MRMGINVPDKLLKRVKSLQPEVNISQVCREALTNHATIQELAAERVARNGAVLERTADLADALPVEPDWVGYALTDAEKWLLKVDPDDWDDFWQLYDQEEQEVGGSTTAVNIFAHRYGNKKDFSDRWDENRANWGGHRAHRRHFAELYAVAEKSYKGAWLAYMKEARRKQREHFEAEYHRVKVARDKANQAAFDPQLPPQILDQPGHAAMDRQEP